MGGARDATNVQGLQPALSVLTPISLDHREFLGETLEEIAAEKAGILKPGVPAVVGAQAPSVLAIIRARADAIGCELAVCGSDWDIAEVDFNLNIL